jgi:hypothetical protein
MKKAELRYIIAEKNKEIAKLKSLLSTAERVADEERCELLRRMDAMRIRQEAKIQALLTDKEQGNENK